MIVDLTITENKIENIQFYKDHFRKDVPMEFFLSAGLDNSKAYLKFTVIVGKESFRYWFHPTDEWLMKFCKAHQVSIIEPNENNLANLNMSKDNLVKILSDIPQCKEWLED